MSIDDRVVYLSPAAGPWYSSDPGRFHTSRSCAGRGIRRYREWREEPRKHADGAVDRLVREVYLEKAVKEGYTACGICAADLEHDFERADYPPKNVATDGGIDLVDDRRGAVFSDDREYRYRLWRTWNVDLPTAVFIMLNPSTADETEDDQTLRRCIDYAKRWGYGRLEVGNLFARTAKDPSELWSKLDPVGPENDEHLEEILDGNVLPVAAWGAYGDKRGRADEVARRFDVEWFCLGTTHSGQPVHPLRQPSDAELRRWSP